MLYGLPSIGKTAVAWQMAQAIQKGEPLWGFPTTQANVLFMELDMPENLAVNRWKDAEPEFTPSFCLAFEPISLDYRMFLSAYPDDRHKKIMTQLTDLHRQKQFGVIFIDALREVVVGDLNSSGIARRVYDAFKFIFPEASIVFIHHERKSAPASVGPSDPIFSAAGSMEFINVAQVTMQFHKRGRDTFLDHRKTQASEKAEPLPISLREDGVNVYHRDAERFAIAADIINNNPSAGMRELDKMIAQRLGISERTARNIRLGIQQTKGSDEAADATSNSG